jgi:pyruvate/2-oxoglutarate/acetoin dehydrogenase E1 component
MFGDFLTLAADQILNHAAKYRWISGGELSVPLVIRTPMGGRRGYGPSHSQTIESMFLGIPGLTVVAPSHLLEPGELLRRAALECNNPVLFIENKVLYPQRLLVNHEGRIGDFRVDSTSSCFPTLRLSLSEPEPPDVTLITYGGNAPIAMEVARRLLIEREVTCEIVLPCLLSPLPVEELLRFARAQTLVATLEEGQTPHGWGASVLAAFAEQAALAGRKCVRIGAAPCPVPAAGTLEALALPSADTVIETILRTLG